MLYFVIILQALLILLLLVAWWQMEDRYIKKARELKQCQTNEAQAIERAMTAEREMRRWRCNSRFYYRRWSKLVHQIHDQKEWPSEVESKKENGR